MKKIGITGGIGSGKTIICEVFKILGVSVFHADQVARVLQDSDAYLRGGLTDLFGESIYLKDGTLDRKKMAALIFNDLKLKKEVSRLVHPAVHTNFLTWIEKTC